MITLNKLSFYENSKKLFKKFSKDRSIYEKANYNEAQLRMDFLDNLWKYLGWNVNNEGLSYQNREVITEKNINSKRVDYQFRNYRTPMFLVEAKKPSEDIEKNEHIFQAKSYAFSSAIPIIILSNFKKFNIYIITEKPYQNLPKENLFWSWDYDKDGLDDFLDYMWLNFSKEAVSKGVLEREFKELVGNKNISEVDEINLLLSKASGILDESFVIDSNRWRVKVAQSILNENPEITEKRLTNQTQLVLNRLIFTRILEDNNLVGETLFKKLKESDRNGTDFVRELFDYFSELDKIYNSNLFVTDVDVIKLEGNLIKEIIQELYFPNTVYNFGAIPLDILGRVFEEFLSHTIKVENKKVSLTFNAKFRKKGGVYYTPQFLVDYVVKNTIEKLEINLVENRFPSIADITCGSGVFLVEAFKKIVEECESQVERLCDQKWGIIDNLIEQDVIRYSDKEERYVITTKTKNRILKTSIFGVDIDEQATEITKLNLFIAMIVGSEDYVDETITPVLPNMIENIMVGNSIVDIDFLDDFSNSVSLLEIVIPYQFTRKYDAIIGNPPYIEQAQLRKSYPDEMLQYLNNKYNDYKYGNYDASILFLYRAYSLLNEDGVLGYVMNQLFLLREYGKNLRKFLGEGKAIKEIVSFEEIQLFKGVTTYIALIQLTKSQNENFEAKIVKSLPNWKKDPKQAMTIIDSSFLIKSGRWKINSDFYYKVMKSINYRLLGDVFPENSAFVGTQTDADDVFLMKYEKSITEKTGIFYSTFLDEKIELEKEIMKPAIKGSRTIHRYFLSEKIYLMYPYVKDNQNVFSLREEMFKSQFPLAWSYLNTQSIKEFLSGRSKVINGSKMWYEYTTPKNMTRLEQPKILLPSMTDGARFWSDIRGKYVFIGSGIGGGGGFGLVVPENTNYTINSLLGILNSEFYNFYIHENESVFNAQFYGIDKSRILEFPLPMMIDSGIINELDNLVTNVLNAYEEWQLKENSFQNRRIFSQQIEYLESNIDKIVYDSFGIKKNIREEIHKKYSYKYFDIVQRVFKK